MPKDLLGAYLREQRLSARLSVRQLSELAGISNPYLSQIERGLKRPSAEILQRIATGLHISAETLYVQAGLLDPEDHIRTDRPTTRDAIRADQALTAKQRQVLLDVYDSFVGSEEDAPEGASAPEPQPAEASAVEKKAPARKTTQKKATAKKAAPRKTAAKKAATKKTAAKKTVATKTTRPDA
ncbi:helix-turn-helix domain-containing protein [Janibacter massiliensis]|uniref:helix-turn-helix domain-containing protein n=1 Tax=Janibacter massiliensis TaxID=2058291 RepID=UPI000D112DCA|nr:helix-turn-helix transcriptional regulator [Janibacter massiliensis]